MSMAGTTSKSFLAAVRLIANGCQQVFEAAELPGLLPALTKARTSPFLHCHWPTAAGVSGTSPRQTTLPLFHTPGICLGLVPETIKCAFCGFHWASTQHFFMHFQTCNSCQCDKQQQHYQYGDISSCANLICLSTLASCLGFAGPFSISACLLHVVTMLYTSSISIDRQT